jgi:segregation and condensation protein B
MRDEAANADTPPPPARIVEALLFVGGPPLSAERASEIVRNLGAEQLRQIVDTLNRDYRKQHRPYAIHVSDEGYTLRLKPVFRGIREKLAGSPREARLTSAARDVLALVAYRQPIAKSEIDSQRGTDSRSQLQQLVRLGLVAVVHQPELGTKESAYVTTARFLEMVGLNSLDDLPRTGDLQQL